MANFVTSTQKNAWMFTPEKLAEIRKECNTRTVDAIRKFEAAGEGPGQPDGGEPGGVDPAECLTPQEEASIVTHYQQKIQETCAAFKFPHKLQATAIIFHKRFYLAHSVMDYHPKAVMLTCIYLACKSEEVYVFAEEFCKGIGQDPRQVLDLELTVLQGLRFHLIVFHPYRSLDGLLAELGTTLELQGVAKDSEQVKVMASSAAFYVDNLMLTDAVFHHPPGQQAMAALRYAARKCGLWDRLGGHVRDLVSRAGSGGEEELAALLDKLDVIRETGRPEKLDGLEVLRAIDTKLKGCRNPATNPAHIVAKREGERAGADKKKRKEKKNRDKQEAARAREAAAGGAEAGGEGGGGGGLAEAFAHAAKRRKSGEAGVPINVA